MGRGGEVDALKGGKEGMKKDGDSEIPIPSFSKKTWNRFWFSETKFGTTWRTYSRHLTAFQHKVDLQPQREFVKFLTTPQMELTAAAAEVVSDTGGKIPPNLLISPKEDSGEISKHVRGESNEITSLKHHKQGPIWSYVLLSLRPDSRGWGGVMNTLSVMVSSALQNGFSSSMEEIPGRGQVHSLEIVKYAEVSAYLTILGLLDNQYVLIYSSHKGDKRLRNSSISPSSFRLLWRMNEVTMVLICVLFNLK